MKPIKKAILRHTHLLKQPIRMRRLTLTAACLTMLPLALMLFVRGAQPAPEPPLGDRDALRLQIARDIVDQTRPPIGAVIAYWGAKADLDKIETWEVCDGKPVKTFGSPLFGKTKPNLSDRFVMGYGGEQDLREQPVIGGTNTIATRKQGETGPVTLTVQQIPAHSHPHHHWTAVATDSADRSLIDHRTQSVVASAVGSRRSAHLNYQLTSVPETPNAGATSSDSTATGGGQAHAHPLPDFPEEDNRPAFVGLYYIIRVK